MSTCKDCLHYEVCQALEDNGDLPKIKPIRCGCFKDRSKFIELPCKVGDYIEWKNNRGNVVLLEIKGFEFDEQGNAQKYLTKYSDIQPFVDSEGIMSVIAKEEAEQALAERNKK